MKMNHICPCCGKQFEKEGVPKPDGESDGPCPECNSKLHHLVKISVLLDYGIYELTGVEENFLRDAVKVACRKRGCELIMMEVSK